MHMNIPTSEFTSSARIGVYEPPFQPWEDAVKGGDSSPNTGGSTIVQVDAMLDHRSSPFLSHDSSGPSRDQEANKPDEKVKRRLAQNREAARKSRLRKKAYVQNLESSRLKLAQIEQDLKKAREQGLHISSALDTGSIGLSGPVNSEVVAFEMEYSQWMDEQHRHNCQLRTALQSHVTPTELRNLVETVLGHYHSLFRMKAAAAKADVFYVMSGMWRTSAERFFLWIGGFRPSELLNVLMPHFDPLTDKQIVAVNSLRQSSQQAEDALSQGMDKLQQTLAHGIAIDPIVMGSYGIQMEDAMEKLETMESFANQADHLRQQTLHQMSRILTTRQAARGLLGLGEYIHRLRALSSLWAARPREPT